MMSSDSTKGHKGIEIEKLVTQRSWRRYMVCLKDLVGRPRKSTGRETAELGTHAFIRVSE